MYTYKVEQAIQAATVLHQEQMRKGAVPVPYISHLIATLMILRDYTEREDTLVAALLHDTLEDTDYTLEELRTDFGHDVAEIVRTLTEPRGADGEKIPWMERKKGYAEQLKKGPKEAVMVAAADKAHNFRSMVEEYYEDPNRFLQDFGPDIQSRLEAYQRIANAINSRLQDGIVHEFNHTFDEYKNFLFDVENRLSQNQ